MYVVFCGVNIFQQRIKFIMTICIDIDVIVIGEESAIIVEQHLNHIFKFNDRRVVFRKITSTKLFKLIIDNHLKSDFVLFI